MMVTEQLDPNRFKPFFDEAKYQLKYWEGQKQQAIIKLAQQLESAGMPPEIISAEISRELEGYVTKRYVQMLLKDKYTRTYEKLEITINADGKSESPNKRNISHIHHNIQLEDNTIEEAPPQTTTTASYDEEVKSLWQQRDGINQSNISSIDYTINKACGTDLITRTEHDREVSQLHTTIDKLNDNKNSDYTKTKEYQDQQQLIEFQKMRIEELEEIETKTIAEFSFQNANTMKTSQQQSVNLTQKVCEELGLPAAKLGKFFLDSRNCKKEMILKHDGHNIVSWRVE